jgi:hypothetical protein
MSFDRRLVFVSAQTICAVIIPGRDTASASVMLFSLKRGRVFRVFIRFSPLQSVLRRVSHHSTQNEIFLYVFLKTLTLAQIRMRININRRSGCPLFP